MVKPAAFRRAVGFVQAEFGLSQRRACSALGFPRSSCTYRGRRAEPSELVERPKALAARNARHGYRMLHLLLRREGFKVNHKRIYRLYRAEGLVVRRRHRKRIVAALRAPLPRPSRPNERWAMDFVHDVTWGGRRFKVLVVIDVFTRECLALVVDTSIGGARAARVLEELVAARGTPDTITVDNGPEFSGKAMDGWAYRSDVKLHFIRPGKPVENAFVESFNGKFRGECLNQHWFVSLDDARTTIESWRTEFNEGRPHSSLAGMTPREYAEAHRGLTPRAA
jgi:putative transposase